MNTKSVRLGAFVGAVLLAGTVNPVDAAGPGAAIVPSAAVAGRTPQPFTRVHVVHLITGDSVRVLSRSDGSTVSTLLPGSPHAAGPVARFGTATGSFVLPRLGSVVRRHLDLSLFDVTALSAVQGDRVPVEVTYSRDAAPRPVAGLRLDRAAAARVAGSAVRVPGWYSTRSGGLTGADLTGISSIRLAGAAVRQRLASTTPTHTLTVHVASPSGGAADATVLIQNVDDAKTYLESANTNRHGNVTVTVPEGHYGIEAFTFSRLVVDPEVDVTADSSVDLDMADATVKPKVTLPNFKVVDTALSVGRSADQGWSFPLVFDGPHFFMRVSPTSPTVAQGELHSGVSATLVPDGTRSRRTHQRLAYTADISRGVPDSLTYAHRRGDFARVVDRWFANGPAGPRATFFGTTTPEVELFTFTNFDTRVPGRRVMLFQAGPNYYQQTLMPQALSDDSNDLTQLISVRRFPQARKRYVIRFAQGPVGPGVERSQQSVGRHGGRLQGYLPLFDGAGSAMSSYVDGRDGSWALRRGRHLLKRGRHQVSFSVRVPRGRHAYVLRATSHPRSRLWRLSTNVRDVWRFHSRRGKASVTVLAPSYRPPLSLHGRLGPGRVAFPLRFFTLAPRDHRVAHAKLQISTDDGRTWRAAAVRRLSPTRFRVRYRNPSAAGTARFMSMRVTGRDGHGNRVTETALRVYRLR